MGFAIAIVNGSPKVFPKSRAEGRRFWRNHRFFMGNRQDKRVPLRFFPRRSKVAGFGGSASGEKRERHWRRWVRQTRPGRTIRLGPRSSSCNPLIRQAARSRADSSIDRMRSRDDSPIESLRPRRPRLFFCSQNHHVDGGGPSRAEPASVAKGAKRRRSQVDFAPSGAGSESFLQTACRLLRFARHPLIYPDQMPAAAVSISSRVDSSPKSGAKPRRIVFSVVDRVSKNSNK